MLPRSEVGLSKLIADNTPYTNNQTEANRHALFGHYRKSSLIFQVDPHDGFPAEWYDLLSQRQRELLRMENGIGVPHAADYHMRQSFARGKMKPS